jgi:hypothetical protein
VRNKNIWRNFGVKEIFYNLLNELTERCLRMLQEQDINRCFGKGLIKGRNGLHHARSHLQESRIRNAVTITFQRCNERILVIIFGDSIGRNLRGSLGKLKTKLGK